MVQSYPNAAIQPQMPPTVPAPSGFMSSLGNGGFSNVTAGIRNITRNFAAGFAKDPAVRQQAAAGQAQADQQAEAQHRDMISASLDRMKTLAAAVQGRGQIPPALAQMLQKESAILSELTGDPAQGQQALDYAHALAQMPGPQQAADYTNIIGPDGQPLGAVNLKDPNVVSQLPAGWQRAGETPQLQPGMTPEAEAQYLRTHPQQPAPQTTVTIQAETEHAKNLDLMRKKLVEDLQGNADKAKTTLQGIKRLNEAMGAGFEPGAGAKQMAAVGTALQRLGIAPEFSERVLHASSATQASQAINEMVKGVIGNLGTGFSNADRDFTERILPQITDTKQAFLAATDYLTKRALGDIQVSHDAYVEYSKPGTGGDPFVPYQKYLDSIGAAATQPVSAATPDQQGGGGQIDPSTLTVEQVSAMTPEQANAIDVTKITDTKILQALLAKTTGR